MVEEWVLVYKARWQLYALFWRDYRVRFSHTLAGVVWAFARPLFMTMVLSLVFGGFFQMGESGPPYGLIVLSGWIPWQLFQTTVLETTSAYQFNASILSRFSLPKLVIPLSAGLINFVDALAGVGLLLAGMLAFGMPLSLSCFGSALCLLWVWLLGISVGLILAGMQEVIRDIRFVVPFLMHALLYIAPIGYLSLSVSSDYAPWVQSNPLSVWIQWHRSLWLELSGPSLQSLLWATGWTFLGLWGSTRYHCHLYPRILDGRQ